MHVSLAQDSQIGPLICTQLKSDHWLENRSTSALKCESLERGAKGVSTLAESVQVFSCLMNRWNRWEEVIHTMQCLSLIVGSQFNQSINHRKSRYLSSIFRAKLALSNHARSVMVQWTTGWVRLTLSNAAPEVRGFVFLKSPFSSVLGSSFPVRTPRPIGLNKTGTFDSHSESSASVTTADCHCNACTLK